MQVTLAQSVLSDKGAAFLTLVVTDNLLSVPALCELWILSSQNILDRAYFISHTLCTEALIQQRARPHHHDTSSTPHKVRKP